MPKKSIEINPFDGGLNDFADARDIEENELAAATNVRTDQPGRIKIGKRIQSVAERTLSGSSTIVAGTGLFHYNTDYAVLSTNEAYTQYQLMIDGNNLWRREISATNWSLITNLGASYEPCFFSIDGKVRIGDGAHSSDTKFFGVTDVDYFDQATDNFLTNTNAYIDAPTDGDLVKDPGDQTDVPPSQNDGYLDWIVQQKTGSTEDWFNFDKNDTNDFTVGYIRNQYGAYPAGILFTQSSYDSNTTYVLASDGDIDAQDGEMLKVIKDGSIADNYDYNRLLLRFTENTSFEEKSIFFDIYMEGDVKDNLKAEALKIRVGNVIASSGTSGNECFIYYIGSDQINADEWTTIEIAQGQHDEVEGTPNASGIDSFMIGTEYLSDSNADTTYYVENLKIGESSRGLWNGKFKFFQSWIYDNAQESNTFQLVGQGASYEVENKILQFRVHGKSGPMQSNRRISGANLYYVEYDVDNNPLDTDKKLLIEVDLERGIKKVGGETWDAWGDAKGSGTGYEAPRNGTNTSYLQIMDPPVLETFSTKAGYNEHEKLKKVKFKAATVMNRRSYVGNVKVTNSIDKSTKYSDRIYKSDPNMPDVYTELGYVDVAINDGEAVTALASFGDMLLQFKERTMYLINCTQEIEYLEDTAKFRGVWGQAAVVETDAGIVWVNQYGLFMFDGKEIVPLIDKKIDPDNWNGVIGAKPILGYVPLDRHVLVVGDSDASSNGYTYSLKSNSFNYLTGNANTNLFTADMTNIVSSNAGFLSWYQDSDATVTEYKWDAAIGDVYIDIQSRDQDFKDPARRKMVKNVYLTYKVPNNGTVPAIKFRTNGGVTDYDFNNALSSASSIAVNWYTIVLKPATSSQANNVYSFQVRLYGATHKDFEINDINVVYRDKVLK